ncbi:histidine kinase [Nitratireductor sp. CAU 1489]|uniref:histidine kinase n=1 Tax=Nitratireductor arenosus TaxID=2682096 RepID=A0A844QCG0_9HYPH|nr:histidine kinase [Nitratireductor arenosus]
MHYVKRYLPLIAFLLVTLVGAGVASAVYRTEEAANRARFEVIANEAVDRISNRVNQHIALLVATMSFFEANGGKVTQRAFARFVNGLDLDGEFDGIHGIGFARLATPADDVEIAREIERNYGLARVVRPETDQKLRAPIILLEPQDARNREALGYDMYAETTRRDAMERAMASGKPRASAPVELVQEITNQKQAGFLVYLPLPAKAAQGAGPRDDHAGFVYAPFRAGDLHVAAFNTSYQLPVEVETTDTTGDDARSLYRSKAFGSDETSAQYMISRSIEVAGRQWTLRMHESPGFLRGRTNFYTFIVGAISLLLAAAIAASARWQIRAVENAHALHALSEQAVKEKELILQEMKHRLKNAIARILAMARQTGARAASVEEFSDSFTARLQAMANAQDMLTRSRWQKADLRELLCTELDQVFGEALGEDRVAGPAVELDEKQSQAFALTFHELATNTLKYGSGAERQGRLKVTWRVEGPPRSRLLRLIWAEQTESAVHEPETRGFGSRLIDANIIGELGGRVERSYGEAGFSVTITVPYRRSRR